MSNTNLKIYYYINTNNSCNVWFKNSLTFIFSSMSKIFAKLVRFLLHSAPMVSSDLSKVPTVSAAVHFDVTF